MYSSCRIRAARAAEPHPPEVQGEAVRPRGALGHRGGSVVTRAFVADASVAIGGWHPGPGHSPHGRDGGCDRGGRYARGARALAIGGRERADRPSAPPEADRGREAGRPPAGCAASRCASTTRWPCSPSHGCRSWRPLTSFASMTRRTSSSRSDGGSCWAARTARCGRRQGEPGSVCGTEPRPRLLLPPVRRETGGVVLRSRHPERSVKNRPPRR